ncbi:MAG: hypothetical protein GF372_10420 [Candidatus Marinimicrobia bacterium]|nr:hypothetical protein [Candidatus Neomarinimicrobiota bacterium]
MEELTIEEMQEIRRGTDWDCLAAVGGSLIFYAGLFVTPVEPAALAVYLASVTFGPTLSGFGIASACSS